MVKTWEDFEFFYLKSKHSTIEFSSCSKNWCENVLVLVIIVPKEILNPWMIFDNVVVFGWGFDVLDWIFLYLNPLRFTSHLRNKAPTYLLLPLGKWGSKWGDFHWAMGVCLIIKRRHLTVPFGSSKRELLLPLSFLITKPTKFTVNNYSPHIGTL